MNRDSKIKWVAALRSGKYQQGRNQLRSADDRFCCLGVLADVVAPEGWASPRVDPSYDWSHYGSPSDLSVKMAERVALDRESEQYLMDMNDNQRASFEQIADYIERKL